jgi:hypothetical protein
MAPTSSTRADDQTRLENSDANVTVRGIRDLLFNKIPGFAWRGEAAPSETWDFIGILFYSKPLNSFGSMLIRIFSTMLS